MTAELKWVDFDLINADRWRNDKEEDPEEISKRSRESYKSALRKSIEEIREKSKQAEKCDFNDGRISAETEILYLLDTLLPLLTPE